MSEYTLFAIICHLKIIDKDNLLSEVAGKLERVAREHKLQVNLQWVPAHWGIEGNEGADMLAKNGTPQKLSPKELSKKVS